MWVKIKHTESMRQDYIEQLVSFLQKLGHTPESLADLHDKALLWGATEEEFAEAVKKSIPLSKPESNLEESHPKDEKKLLKKLVEFDLALHGVVIMLLGVLALFLFQTFGEQPTTISSQQAITKESPLLFPQVYAKSIEVNSQQVFSYPPKPLTLAISGTPKREIYGYFPYWMLDNQASIPLETLTTLSYFGLTVNKSGSIITTYADGTLEKGWQSWSSPQLQSLITRAKQNDIHLELTLKSFNNEDIESLVTSDEAQKTFINNAIQLIQAKAFDGVNLDFEYSGTPDPEIAQGFSRLVTNLKSEMTQQIPEATLTVSTYVTEAAMPRLIEIEQVSRSVDSFVIMGYDFHTPSGAPGPVAPLDGPLSITGLIQSYLEKVTPDKIILALPHYGYDWLEDETQRDAHRILPFVVVGEESKKYGVQWDEIAKTPWYTYTDESTQKNRIVHFENTRSLGLKYDFINKKDLKGVGIWALGYDGANREITLLLQEKFMR